MDKAAQRSTCESSTEIAEQGCSCCVSLVLLLEFRFLACRFLCFFFSESLWVWCSIRTNFMFQGYYCSNVRKGGREGEGREKEEKERRRKRGVEEEAGSW